jgi:hypothetical protein
MSSKLLFSELEHDRVYSFNEIKALYDFPVQYYKLYAALDIERVDKRLIVFKQLTKNKIMTFITDEDIIKRLAEKLSQKPLSEWRDSEFAHIDGVKLADAADLLVYYDEVKNLIPQLRNRIDIKLLIRNSEYALTYKTLDEMKTDLVNIDGAWNELIGKLGFKDEFLFKNQERVYEFLCMNNADIANKLYDNLDTEEHRESLRRIVQAELMGELSKLKYYEDDLRREIEYPLNAAQKSIWLENTAAVTGNVTIKERDDFYHTIMLGTIPYRTCMSYDDTDYCECLLSGFDSNKKVIFAYIDEKIVGRAIIRLTKGKFENNNTPAEKKKELYFVDLEKVEAESDMPVDSEKDRLLIFLERSYSSGISDEITAQIDDMYIDLMDKKSAKMSAMLILSNSYQDRTRTDFTQTLFHVYISKSKAGAQYLDSLNGAAHVSDEGGYKSNKFFIRKGDML